MGAANGETRPRSSSLYGKTGTRDFCGTYTLVLRNGK